MRSSKPGILRLVQISLAAMVLFSACGGVGLTSQWRKGSIEVDGNDSDWAGIPAYIEKNKYSVRVCNDDEFIYLCIASQEPQIEMQILRSGFTVWFDREGGSEKRFGIRFPLGGPPPGPGGEMQRGDDDRNPSRPRIEPGMMNDLEILGVKESDRQRLSFTEVAGIQAKIGRSSQGKMVYELRIPLKKSDHHPFAVEPMENKHLGIGFETGDVTGGRVGERPNEGPPGGMDGGPPPMGGMPGGGPPGGDKMPRRGGPDPGRNSEPVKLWIDVTLSQKQ